MGSLPRCNSRGHGYVRASLERQPEKQCSGLSRSIISPELNPNEQVFARLKAPLRTAAAQTKEAIWATIDELLDSVPAGECQNYLSNCGYEFT
jgi:transposase